MFIQVFPSGPISTNAYVIACLETMQAFIIDPAPNSSLSIKKCLNQKGFSCQGILLTHSHWDHIIDVKPLKDELNIPVYVHALDRFNLEKPGSDQLPCYIAFEGVKPDFLIENGMSLALGNLQLEVIHTPGHSPGSVCFYIKSQSCLISGDTLFQGSMGNISFPTSEPSNMWDSLKHLATLPSQTKVFPGHGKQTTIGVEHEWMINAQNLFS